MFARSCVRGCLARRECVYVQCVGVWRVCVLHFSPNPGCVCMTRRYMYVYVFVYEVVYSSV